MPSIKRPKLATHYSGPRAGTRDSVSLEGRCSVGEGPAAPVAVLDLDARGCQLTGIAVAVSKADMLRLWLGGIGPIEGRLRWAKHGSAGIAFDRPLEDAELASARMSAPLNPSAEVVPLRKRLTSTEP